jgi:hypothetical protein
LGVFVGDVSVWAFKPILIEPLPVTENFNFVGPVSQVALLPDHASVRPSSPSLISKLPSGIRQRQFHPSGIHPWSSQMDIRLDRNLIIENLQDDFHLGSSTSNVHSSVC